MQEAQLQRGPIRNSASRNHEPSCAVSFDELYQRLHAIEETGCGVAADFDGPVSDLNTICLLIDFGIGLCGDGPGRYNEPNDFARSARERQAVKRREVIAQASHR